MITVADILALPSLENVELVSPCSKGASREVRNVGILDCPPDYNEYSVYMPREFILTNLGFAYGNPEMAEKSLLTMIRRDVAAIAIKKVYEPPISDLVREESLARGVPLYLYDGGYHEKLSYESLDLIRRDQEESDKGKAIDALLITHDGDSVRNQLHDTVGVAGSMMQCYALVPRAGDKCSFYATVDAVSVELTAVKDSSDVVESLSVYPYQDRILVLLSYGSASNEEMRSIDERCIALITASGNVRCGVGEIVRLGDGDLSIHQALTAADVVPQKGARALRWSELYATAFADAARSSRLFMCASELYQSMLARYDKEHGAELMATAEALVRSCGDVRAVAEELHQHPNTVRYRVRKMKAILGIPDESDKRLLSLLDLTFLPLFEAVL